jgi:hypothetical protein
MAKQFIPGEIGLTVSKGPSGMGGNGINPGYGCGMNINAKPTGGGRIAGGYQRGTAHPKAKNLPSNNPSAKTALKGYR